MRVVCVGSTSQAENCLREIARQDDNQIVGILTLRDNLAVRRSTFSCMDHLGIEFSIPVYKIKNIGATDTINLLRELNPDLIFQTGWSQVIPQKVLDIPKLGVVGIHPSLLPRNRGGAVLNWAIIRGETDWGVTLYYLSSSLDQGDIIDQMSFVIEPRDDIRSVYDKADRACVQLLRKNLPLLRSGSASRCSQNPDLASLLHQRKPEDGRINWDWPVIQIDRMVRAVTHPFPGAFCFLNEIKLMIWSCEPMNDMNCVESNSPGIVDDVCSGRGIVVRCGDGSLLLKRVQLEGDIECWADELAEELSIRRGERLP